MKLILFFMALPIYSIGAMMCWHVARPQRSPADSSNRINKIRLVWFALTREDMFVDVFPWLKRDEAENVK